MRRKLLIGLFLAAAVGLVAGDYWMNRTGAQDAGKKSDEKKSDGNLYDILNKDLESKKDAPPVLPVPPILPDFGTTSTNPPPKIEVAPPPLPSAITPPQVVPPLEKEPVKPDAPVFPPPKPPVEELKPLPGPFPILPQDNPKVDGVKPPPLTQAPLESAKPGPLEFPALPPQKNTPMIQKAPVPQPIAEEVAKIKNCPWRLQIEMVDGLTVVIATVNKKHEFKIVCHSLDLQTGKGTLRASGKVKISGESLTGSCDHLAIPLMEDRLVLEGGAAVSIQKVSTNVSDAKPSAFELKGDNLTLRISDLEASKFLQTSLQPVTVDTNVRQAAAAAPALNDKRWTGYGKLVRNETKVGPDWRLEKSNGEVIAHLTAREGGTLEPFVGQTISVFGTNEDLDGNRVLRVTRIALP